MFDLLFVVAAVAAAVGGYRLGLIARVTSWFGLAIGVVVGSMVLPVLLKRLHDTDDATVALVAISTLVGAALVGQAAGLVLGSKAHIALPAGNLRTADQAAGSVAGVVGLLVGLWLLLPTLGDIPGRTSEQARSSVIAREVADFFPPAPDTIQALRRLVGDDPFPKVFDRFQPAPDPGTPPAESGLDQARARAVAQSVVKVEGEACGRLQEGTGFFVSENLVVTNAHVVAGEDNSVLELADGSEAEATVVAFDPDRDLAVLLTGASGPALQLADAAAGDIGGVFGHPGGRDLEISPFEVSEQISAQGRDIYDQAATERQVLVLASDLEPGDSGSALIDPAGRVIGVAFAVAPDKPGVGYALAVEELRPLLDGLPIGSLTEQDTRDCLV
ncbi:MAG TPA: MarP family serine protease [Acidimicrobiales bacterium]|nr:MarP family serine protease [Acidimicrobiales bacterium]